MSRTLAAVAAVGLLLVLPALAVAGHGLRLDHPATSFDTQVPPSPALTAGGAGAKWETIASFPTGNPHTDIDFFTRGGETYVSAGTLGIGPNAGGQEIFRLTQGGKVAPKFVTAHPSASCLSNPADARGLQHDVEASPKGGAILNTDVRQAARGDAQLLIDATDAPARCHDQGVFGLADAPQGGLEIIDVTDVGNPQEIGLTSHIGEAHTVNVDPRRPHIAYAVTSDAINVDERGRRLNEDPANADRFDLDGFEIVDMSSCMNFAAGTTLQQKRDRCRPRVYRYRYPSTEMSLGHTLETGADAVFGCHELEVYPDERLMCAGGNAMIALDLSGAFDDNRTPGNFLDDKPRGTALPCRVRDTTSPAPFETGAKITDCVDGEGPGGDDLTVAKWLTAGAPSLTGVRWLGSAFHQGRGAGSATAPAFDSTQDIDFDHEAELTASGRFVLATDERGGGTLPPGASCSPGVDVKIGNGGVHAYRVDRLLRRRPTSAEDAFRSYATDSNGNRAIYRAPIRTRPQESLCTAHVFQQIPGQNRIFMGWYTQGTQVVDFTENANGTIDFKEAGYFIPASADQWVSHVFKVERNDDGSFTYYGVSSDFALGTAGRNAVEVYKVTLPAPPAPRGSLVPGTGVGFEPSSCLARRVRIGARAIGRLKLGQSRSRTARRARPLGNVARRTRVLRYCVKESSLARAAAVFDRRGKLRLATTNARGHTRGRIGPGYSSRALRRRFGRRLRSLGGGLRLVAAPRRSRSRVLFAVRRGKVRSVAIVDRRLARRARTLKAYVRLAKLR